MKKFLLSSMLVLSVASLAGFFGRPACAQAADREWLILVYVNAINDRGLNGGAKELINQLEKIGSSEKVAVVVKYGILETDANKALKFPQHLVTLSVQKDSGNPDLTSPVIDSTPVQDMAKESGLYLFARKNILKYPSKKVMLCYFGKGNGWDGLGQDDLSRNSMSIGSVAGALAKITQATGRKIDLLMTDADCMQTLEVVYEWKDYADIIIGAEEKTPRIGYMYDLISGEFLADPALDSRKAASSVVYFSESLVNSAVKTEKLSAFLPLLDRWIDAVMADPSAMKLAREQAKKTLLLSLTDSRDFGEFLYKLTTALPKQHPAVQAGTDLWNFLIHELILASHKTFMDQETNKIISRPEYEQAQGLAIYLPDLKYNSAMYERLSFAAASRWPKFILALLNQTHESK